MLLLKLLICSLYIVSHFRDSESRIPLRWRRHKTMIVSAIIGGGAAAKLLKPKKGILPIPLPIPIPFPIEWEQPPVVIHPKKEIVSVPSLDDRSEEKKKSTTTTTTTQKPDTDYNDDEW